MGYPQPTVLDFAQMRMLKTWAASRGWALLLCSIVICASVTSAQVQAAHPEVSPGPVFPDAAQSSAAPSATLSRPGADGKARLGIGDLVELSVYDVPELNMRTRVNSGGDLYLPLIDYVHVEGLTIEDAERVIERRLEQGGFVRNPHVQLFVTDFTSAGVNVLGEVGKPGIYPVLGEQKLFDVISAAGGLTDRAGRSVSITHRAQQDKQLTLTISRNVDEHPESNVSVFAGDTIVVRRADAIYVVGDVARPSGFLMNDNGHLSVLQAIALAGGTTSTAKLSGTRIIRKGPAGLTEIPVPLKKLLQAKADDIPLEGEDILFVPASSRKIISGRTAEAAAQLATGVGLVALRP